MGPTQTVEDEEDNFNVNFIRVGDTPAGDDTLLQQVECFWETDFRESISDHKTAMSVHYKKALQIFEASAGLVDGHYQVGLPWKNNPPFLPNNRSLALRRLSCLKRRFQKDQELFEKYKTSIHEYIEKGYAARVPQEERDDIISYLPHHPVFQPYKPGKVRVRLYGQVPRNVTK